MANFKEQYNLSEQEIIDDIQTDLGFYIQLYFAEKYDNRI